MNLFLRSLARPALFCFFLFACFLDTTAQETRYRTGVKTGLVKVKFKRELTSALDKFKPVPASSPKTGIAAFDNVAKVTRTKGMRRMFPYNPRIEAKLRKHGLHLWYMLEIDSNSNPLQVASAFKGLKEVAIAEADHKKVLKPLKSYDLSGFFVSTLITIRMKIELITETQITDEVFC